MSFTTFGRRPMRGAGLSRAVAVVACIGVAGCSGESQQHVATARDSAVADSVARVRQDSVNRAQPGYVVDSIFTPEEEIRRFRATIGGTPVAALGGGSASRDALARRFVLALARSDTGDLRRMAVQPREFADIYYPVSPYSHPPYHQPPDLAWRLIQDPSSAGLTKLLRQVAGTPLNFAGSICDPKVLREGSVTRYQGCLLRLVDAKGDTVSKRYFGSIIEHRGQFKFLSYTNDF